MNLEKLIDKIKKVCPVDGIQIGNLDDKKTWMIDYCPEATEEEKKKAQEILENYDFAFKDECIESVKKMIDLNTDNIIINNFIYNDILFKLTQEFQLNLIAIYTSKEMYQFNGDIQIKGYNPEDGSTIYIKPTSVNEFVSLYMYGMKFIQDTLKKGWEMKDALNDLTVEELQNYVDERTL